MKIYWPAALRLTCPLLSQLLSLAGRTSVLVCRVIVGLQELRPGPARGPGIDLQQVQSLVEEMGTSLSPGAQHLMDMVQFQQRVRVLNMLILNSTLWFCRITSQDILKPVLDDWNVFVQNQTSSLGGFLPLLMGGGALSALAGGVGLSAAPFRNPPQPADVTVPVLFVSDPDS